MKTVMASDSETRASPPLAAGILIVIISSLINGSTFVLHKKGIIRSHERGRLKQRISIRT